MVATNHPTPSLTLSLDRAYTFEEFLTAFDGVHAEWLPNGNVELKHMGTSLSHIELVQWLVSLLKAYLDFTQAGRIFSESFVQRLSPDLPAREPDILVVLNQHADRIKPTHLDGAADIVIEIVSPESVERDYGSKFREYERGGVQEYWLIDPERRLADVYAMGSAGVYHRRSLDDHGRLTSGVLPKFALTPDMLWSETKPDLLSTLRLVSEMLGISLRDML